MCNQKAGWKTELKDAESGKEHLALAQTTLESYDVLIRNKYGGILFNIEKKD